MSRVEIREDRCKGCLLCTTVCPESLLTVSGKMNVNGYKVVHLPESCLASCKGCSFCAEICPDCAIVVFRTKKRGKSHEDGEGESSGEGK